MIKRVVLIILDGLGVGCLEDAKKYNDEGANTLNNIYKTIPNFNLPTLTSLGLYNLIQNLNSNLKIKNCIGSYGKMAELSEGKDTTTGHWEIAGVITKKPFPTYPNGFPKEIIMEFEKRIGKKTLGNFPCSGTEILKLLGEEHMRTGYPIVYTSADSVFQIAAHEEIIPVEELYHYCKIARDILGNPPFEEHKVARVIARPFIGTNKENFKRTEKRKDFSISPPAKTILDYIKEAEGEVIGIGKIDDIFAHQGVTRSFHTKNNTESIETLLQVIKNFKSDKTLIFVNLVDFDTLWGHRRDVFGYYKALEYFDYKLENIINELSQDDLLIITSDHGNDPTYKIHTDHTREYVPLILYSKNKTFKSNINLNTRETFADIAKSIEEIFDLGNKLKIGKSFIGEIFKK
ncbi:MAG: phosphopentomutase [Elusimicrobiota bacterium]|nr:phosphopentomutase [Endomicrobiia bacterium]MDW8165228.1 phosphopentomutase [Elusimicrobiota bacterium]